MRLSGVGPVLVLLALTGVTPASSRAEESAALVALDDASLSPHDQNQLLVARGHARESAGQKDDALVDYTRAIESRSLTREEQTQALFDRGLLLDGMDRLNDALGDYTAAINLIPKFAAALNNRANVYRRLSRFTEARRDYQASLTAGNGQRQYPYYGLGQIAEAQGNAVEAKAFYSKALAAQPDFRLAADGLAALGSGGGAIHLHPPAVTAKTAAVDEGPITLHPPGFQPAPQQPIHLHPPRSPGPTITPAAYDGAGGDPVLKPSLDEGVGYGSQIQLGAWRSKVEAAQGWERALKRAQGALEGLSPHIVAVDLPGAGRYYRLRVSGPKTLCATLAAKGLDCMPVRN